jgi:hypothetical protein
VLTDADAPPAYRIYEDETAIAILTGTMAVLDTANTTGFYTELIACTSANGFENRKTYTIYIEATVDGDTGGITFGFKISNASGIRKNQALPNFEFLMVSNVDHVTPKTGLAPGSFGKTESIDGAAFSSLSGAITEVGVGIYKIDLTAAELNGDVITLRFTYSGADDRFITVKTNA